MSMPCKGPERTTIKPAVGRPDLSSGAFQNRADRSEMFEMGAENLEMTAGDRGGDGVGPRLDAVGDQIVAGVVEGIHALHQNPMCSRRPGSALPSPARAEREIADFGIARRVQDLGFAARERRRHQGRLGCTDRWRRTSAMRPPRKPPSLVRAWM